MRRKYPFKNLVFKGGGIKAFAYIGAIEVLEEWGVLSQIERVGGNSAGSMMALLVSFRLSAQETTAIFETIDYSKVASLVEDEESTETTFLSLVIHEKTKTIRGGVEAFNRLRRNYGLFSSDFLHNWLQEVVAEYCHGNGRATFKDFRKCGFRDLYIVATNVSAHRIATFSAETTPHVAVADAVITSGSIPFFFEARQFDGVGFGQGDYYVDGGVLANYPIHIFDGPEYGKGNRYYDQGVNWETLGCRLYTPDECKEQIEPITNLISFVKNLIETLAVSNDEAFQRSLIDRLRTINISNCCVDTTDFSVRPGTPKYEELVAAGKSATRDFLEGYQPPKSLLTDIKKQFGRLLGW